MQEKPPRNTTKFIPPFTNPDALCKEVRTIVDTFGNKQTEENPAQIGSQDSIAIGYEGALMNFELQNSPSTFAALVPF